MPKIGTILNEVVKAINERDYSFTGNFRICYLEGEIRCIPARHCPNAEITFGVFQNRSLEIGLTTKDWDTLQARIIKFYKLKGIL